MPEETEPFCPKCPHCQTKEAEEKTRKMKQYRELREFLSRPVPTWNPDYRSKTDDKPNPEQFQEETKQLIRESEARAAKLFQRSEPK